MTVEGLLSIAPLLVYILFIVGVVFIIILKKLFKK